MLQLKDRPVLIIGGGKVAARKASTLIAAGAEVYIVSPKLDESLKGFRSQFHWMKREYSQEILRSNNYLLIFAATNKPELNRQISLDAGHYGRFVNVIDDAALSHFHNMVIIERGTFTIGISSNSASPALLHILKERIAAAISDGLVMLGTWLGSLRSVAKVAIHTQEERQDLYERIIASEVLTLLEAGKKEDAQNLFNAIVEEAL